MTSLLLLAAISQTLLAPPVEHRTAHRAVPVRVVREAVVMGTTLWSEAFGTGRPETVAALESALRAVEAADRLLSTWRLDTPLARLNHAPPHEWVPVGPALTAVLDQVACWSHASGGAFDPALGALLDSWDLRGAGRVPSADQLAGALRATGLRHFQWDSARSGWAARDAEAAWLDSGAFGKGLALRDARDSLRAHGVAAARLNFGGQVLLLGSPGGATGWLVPVAHPARRDSVVLRLVLHDRSVATSAQSERFVAVGGRRVGHILDPRTGQPVAPWGSVTVVAEDPLVADILSTALFVLGPDAGPRWLAEHDPDAAVLWLRETPQGVAACWSRALGPLLDRTSLSGVRLVCDG